MVLLFSRLFREAVEEPLEKISLGKDDLPTSQFSSVLHKVLTRRVIAAFPWPEPRERNRDRLPGAVRAWRWGVVQP